MADASENLTRFNDHMEWSRAISDDFERRLTHIELHLFGKPRRDVRWPKNRKTDGTQKS